MTNGNINEEEPKTGANTWKRDDPYDHVPEKSGDPWEACAKHVYDYDQVQYRRWKEDIDTQLIFTTLFCAIVSPFTVDSYKWLPTLPPNSSNTKFSSTVSRWINALWFLSLGLSLLSMLVSINCKYWLHEHQRAAPLMAQKERLHLRQMRNDALHQWGALALIELLPIIISYAVYCFLAGLLLLLLALDLVVALPLLVVVAVYCLYSVYTTIMPAYHVFAHAQQKAAPCPYKSPLALLFYRMTVSLARIASRARYPSEVFSDWMSMDLHFLRNQQNAPDLRLRKKMPAYLRESLKWCVQQFGHSLELRKQIFFCLQEFSIEDTEDVISVATPVPQHMFHDSSIEKEEQKVQSKVQEARGAYVEKMPRELVNFYFWEPWYATDVGIKHFGMELLLRCISHPWTPSVFRSVALQNAYSIVTEYRLSGWDEKSYMQLVLALRSCVSEDLISHADITAVLAIVGVCWEHFPLAVRKQAGHLLLDITAWLGDGTDAVKRVRSRHCLNVVRWIIDDTNRYHLVSNMRFLSLIRILDEHIVSLDIDPSRSCVHMSFTWAQAKADVSEKHGLPPGFFLSKEAAVSCSNVIQDASGRVVRSLAGKEGLLGLIRALPRVFYRSSDNGISRRTSNEQMEIIVGTSYS